MISQGVYAPKEIIAWGIEGRRWCTEGCSPLKQFLLGV